MNPSSIHKLEILVKTDRKRGGYHAVLLNFGFFRNRILDYIISIPIFALFFSFSFQDGIQHSYVVDGQDADPHEWPWQVMILLKGTLQCGGSLIDDEWVLTAASCVKDNPNPSFYSVTVGKSATVYVRNITLKFK